MHLIFLQIRFSDDVCTTYSRYQFWLAQSKVFSEGPGRPSQLCPHHKLSQAYTHTPKILRTSLKPPHQSHSLDAWFWEIGMIHWYCPANTLCGRLSQVTQLYMSTTLFQHTLAAWSTFFFICRKGWSLYYDRNDWNKRNNTDPYGHS